MSGANSKSSFLLPAKLKVTFRYPQTREVSELCFDQEVHRQLPVHNPSWQCAIDAMQPQPNDRRLSRLLCVAGEATVELTMSSHKYADAERERIDGVVLRTRGGPQVDVTLECVTATR